LTKEDRVKKSPFYVEGDKKSVTKPDVALPIGGATAKTESGRGVVGPQSNLNPIGF
jgi:hypothetical protein